MGRIRLPVLAVSVILIGGPPTAQVPTAADRFEVVSIRRNLTGEGENNGPQPGRYVVRNGALASLIMV